MYSNWIPQNLQKRVFLYILQQLSLFSGIDLPNLEEVSLGNIHLRDVSLDPEKITKIPGLRLRHGNLRSVALKGSVKDGAHLEIAGVDLVVAPSIDNLHEDIENAQASLAQSSADLTSTILLDSPLSPGSSPRGSGENSPASPFSTPKEPSNSFSSPASRSPPPSTSEKDLPRDLPQPPPSTRTKDSSDTTRPRASSSESARRPSSLGGVMSRAIDIALSKLQIRISDINVKLIVEPVDLLLHIDEVVFSYKTGIKLISIKGVRVSVARPFFDKAMRGHKGDASRSSPETQKNQPPSSETAPRDRSEDGVSEDSQSEESDDDMDYMADEPAEESLMDSMVFTHEEASSIYMSATSQTLPNPQNKDTVPSSEEADIVPLFYIDYIDVSFQNVSPLSNVRVDIKNINVSAVPLLPTVSIVLNSLSKLFKLSIHQLRKRNSLNKPTPRPGVGSQVRPQPDVASESLDDSDESCLLERFHINRIEVSLTSALEESGSFASFEDEVNIVLANLTIKLKDENLTYGGLETFEILRYIHGEKSHLFHFDPSKNAPQQSSNETTVSDDAQPPNRTATEGPKKADIRFEYSKIIKQKETMASELTILISRPGYLKLDASSLKYLINLSLWISSVNENLDSFLKTLKQFNDISNTRSAGARDSHVPGPSSSQIILQTASFEAELKLSPTTVIKSCILPISFDKIHDQFTIPRINICIQTNDVQNRILTVSDIHLHFLPTKFASFHYSATNAAPRKSSLKSNTSLVIGSVDGSMSFSVFSSFMDDIKLFLTDLENADSVNCLETVISNHQVGTNKINLAQSNNLMSSMYSSQSRFKRLTNAQVMFGDISSPSYSLRLSINSVKFCFTDISVPFGGLEILANGIEILRPTTGVCGHIISLRLRRSLVPSEFLLNHISRSNKDYPIIQFRKKGDENLVFELVCRGFLVDYHVNWLNLLNACKDQTPDESNKAQTTSTSSSHQNGAEIRILYQDFAFGMIPGRLGSKFYLTGANGSSDVALKTDHFFIKSSFRDLKLLLIDDIKSIASEKSSTTSSTIYSKLTDAGYVDVGHINLVHVGVTISTDMEMVKINSQSFADELSVVELKVNIDSACMDLCADSAHTLLQTINDLKEPVVFKDEEKFRVRGRKDFSLPLDIFDDLGVSTEGEKNHLQEKLNGNPPDAKKSHMAKDEFFFVDEFYSKSHSKEHEINDRLNNIDLNSSSSSSKDRSLRLVESHFVEKEHSISGSILPLSLALNVNQAEVYLHDGYDWKSTRKSIKSAVQSLEKRTLESSEDNLQKATINRRSEGEATSKNPEQNQSTMPDHREDNVDYQSNNSKLTQTIFQSIHIETDKNVGSSNLIEIINAQVRGDAGTGETELEAHTNVKVDKSFKDLKLKRSHGHKISAECKNIAVKVKSYPEDDFAMDLLSPKSEFAVMNSVEVSLGSIDVKDNVQSSTWNRMLTYMNALGEREIGTNMLALTITNVRPDSRMPYTEAIISLKVLPLRLFVDQDTLAFATRFFGFKDSRFALPVDEIIFVQKLTIDPIRVKFDYKPKSVDYAGIRSGNNAELANFFILDGSDLRLKKAVIYGAHGFPKVGKALAQIYGPYIQKYQLSGLLSGLSPVKSILNVGSGVKDLVAFPIQEYKRDGRIFYGLQKGSKSFAKSTTNELLRLGVKLASGAQVILENSEEYFGGEGASARRPKKSPKEKPIPPKPKVEKRKNLLESSQMLRSSVVIDSDQYSKPMSYIHSAIDEEDSEPEMENLQSSILVFNNTTDEEENEDNLSEETEKKLTSLYSNQPANAKEGLRSAYKAMGHNFKGSKKKFRELRRELKNADTLQEQIVSVAKKSPVIVIRPLIGGTEAMMKTLIGISNGIDSRSLQESHDKYRTDKD